MDEQTYCSDAPQVIVMNKEHVRVGFFLYIFVRIKDAYTNEMLTSAIYLRRTLRGS